MWGHGLGGLGESGWERGWLEIEAMWVSAGGVNCLLAKVEPFILKNLVP